jgi:hypothetical protein
VPRASRTRAVSAVHVRRYLAKAEEYLAAATTAELYKDLARLLPLKTKAEYEPDEVQLSEARRAVERAKRCVLVARRSVPGE